MESEHKKIIELAKREYKTTNSECTVRIEDAQPDANGITRLKSLTVGPFRGFTKPENFDLDRVCPVAAKCLCTKSYATFFSTKSDERA